MATAASFDYLIILYYIKCAKTKKKSSYNYLYHSDQIKNTRQGKVRGLNLRYDDEVSV